MNPTPSRRTPVSVICAFTDPDVLASCLQRSVDSGLALAPRTELIAIDNRGNPFPTAGAVLNHGARSARNAVLVFVHQDVVLHSLEKLERAAYLLERDPLTGIIGAVGIDHHGQIIGRLRDRVVHIGESAAEPRDVDSVDEVLFMIRREQVLRSPLTEDPRLAWHAYGVEYSARVRRAGMRATAMDLSITHNSLTINLDKLDDAHRRVAEGYPESLPLQTTCGTVHRSDGSRGLVSLARRRLGLATWWSESIEARAIERDTGESVVLADIRILVDEVVERAGATELLLLDLAGAADTSIDGLSRFGRRFEARAVDVAGARAIIAGRTVGRVIVVTGLLQRDLSELSLGGEAHTVGLWRPTGLWVLIGIDRQTLAPLWSTARNRPFIGIPPGRQLPERST